MLRKDRCLLPQCGKPSVPAILCALVPPSHMGSSTHLTGGLNRHANLQNGGHSKLPGLSTTSTTEHPFPSRMITGVRPQRPSREPQNIAYPRRTLPGSARTWRTALARTANVTLSSHWQPSWDFLSSLLQLPSFYSHKSSGEVSWSRVAPSAKDSLSRWLSNS